MLFIIVFTNLYHFYYLRGDHLLNIRRQDTGNISGCGSRSAGRDYNIHRDTHRMRCWTQEIKDTPMTYDLFPGPQDRRHALCPSECGQVRCVLPSSTNKSHWIRTLEWQDNMMWQRARVKVKRWRSKGEGQKVKALWRRWLQGHWDFMKWYKFTILIMSVCLDFFQGKMTRKK